MKKLAILTSGGDAAGMNNAIHIFTLYCEKNEIVPIAIINGFEGLVNNRFQQLNYNETINHINCGGTFIKTSRFVEFSDDKNVNKSVENLKENNIDGLVIIGGNGSYKGALLLAKKGIQVIALPGTIDNDIYSTEKTIGFLSAVKAVEEVVDSVRNVSFSHSNVQIVETMGRNQGDIALYSGIITSANLIISKELPLSKEFIVEYINDIFSKNKFASVVIVMAEHVYDMKELIEFIQNKTNVNVKSTTVAYLQRGISPVPEDIMLATKLAIRAIELFIKNKTNIALGIEDNDIVETSLELASCKEALPNTKLINLAKKIMGVKNVK